MKIKELKKQYDFGCIMANLDLDIYSIAEKIIEIDESIILKLEDFL